MSLESALEQYDRGDRIVGWHIFRYRPIIGLARLLAPLALLTTCGVIIGLLVINHPDPWARIRSTQEYTIVALGLAAVALSGVAFLCVRLRPLLSAGAHVLLVTDAGVIKRYNGRVESFPLPAISQLTNTLFTGYAFLPYRELSFIDTRDDRYVLLIRGRMFGAVEAIADAIRRRLAP